MLHKACALCPRSRGGAHQGLLKPLVLSIFLSQTVQAIHDGAAPQPISTCGRCVHQRRRSHPLLAATRVMLAVTHASMLSQHGCSFAAHSCRGSAERIDSRYTRYRHSPVEYVRTVLHYDLVLIVPPDDPFSVRVKCHFSIIMPIILPSHASTDRSERQASHGPHGARSADGPGHAATALGW